MYRELKNRLQHDTCEKDMDYHMNTDGLVIFRVKIYVSDDSELKNIFLRKFHVKPYSGHSRYQKTLKVMENL